MGVDEAGQEYGLTEVAHLSGGLRAEVAPAPDGGDPTPGNENRAVLNRRLRNRQNDSGAECDELGSSHQTARRRSLLRAATLWVFALVFP